MKSAGLLSRSLALVAALLMALPTAAFAEDTVGWPYRGPRELTSGGGSDDDDDSGNDEADDGTSAPDDGSGAPDDGTAPPDGGTSAPGGPTRGKSASVDGQILWSWWWEHNKDRFLARATERGRVNAGSAQYWFGSGAKFPPRDITPVSEAQRRRIYDTAAARLKDKSAAVRAAAAIALGRIGDVPPNAKEKEASASNEKLTDNMPARALLAALDKEGNSEVRKHLLLGIGLTEDPKAAASLARRFKDLATDEKPYALIAFGLARATEAALAIVVGSLPRSASSRDELNKAAILAVGLYGRDLVEEIAKHKTEDGKRNGIEQIEFLTKSERGDAATVAQSMTTAARLNVSLKNTTKATRAKSLEVKYAAILGMAEYSNDEKQAETAWKALKKAYKGSQQIENFVLMTAGDLAGRLGENSKTRGDILKWLNDKKQLGSNDNYTRACTVIALGAAGDETAIPSIAELIQNTTVDHYVVGACAVALGMLKAADQADVVLKRAVNGTYNAEAKGYGLIGLALMGDTTRIKEITDRLSGSKEKQIARQVTLAVGVLGDRRNTGTLTRYIKSKWKTSDRFKVSNAAFGHAWLRDANSVEELVKQANSSGDADVRAMATIALGYIGSRDRVSGLTRTFEQANYKKRFSGFQTLQRIAAIL
ncbi:MAG: hypothetical protein AAGD14_13575 [Planctomycetota bacterium]